MSSIYKNITYAWKRNEKSLGICETPLRSFAGIKKNLFYFNVHMIHQRKKPSDLDSAFDDI